MSEHVSIERMNELLDGTLSSAERERLERHFEACAACRNEHARLSEVVRAVAALPREARTPDEAWGLIASRIAGGERRSEGGSRETQVIALPTPGAHRAARRIELSIPQLAAAAAVVAMVSAGMVWLSIGGPGREALVDAVAAVEEPGGAAARAVFPVDTRYQEVTVELEAILDGGRSLLRPETLETIEQSLATIDGAIAEVEAALAEDPSSDLLRRMLAGQRRTRLGVLQRAAEAVRAQT